MVVSGGQVVVLFRDEDLVHVWTVRDGHAVRLDAFRDVGSALAGDRTGRRRRRGRGQRVAGAASRLRAAAAVVLALLAAGGERAAAADDPRLGRVRTFAFAIGDGASRARLSRFDLVVVDGEEASRRRVRALRRRGTIVLAYLSVGTIERPRFWYRKARRYRLDRYEEFGEWYADTSRRGYRRLIDRRVAPRILRKGFSGLFLDNTDMVETHRRQRRGMRLLVRALARRVHRRRGLLFTQNGDDTIGSTLRHYDGWNREDVSWTYDFERRRYVRVPGELRRAALATLARFRARGLLVTATDYVRRGDAAAEAESVRNACSAGALPFVSNIGLNRMPAAPYHC